MCPYSWGERKWAASASPAAFFCLATSPGDCVHEGLPCLFTDSCRPWVLVCRFFLLCLGCLSFLLLFIAYKITKLALSHSWGRSSHSLCSRGFSSSEAVAWASLRVLLSSHSLPKELLYSDLWTNRYLSSVGGELVSKLIEGLNSEIITVLHRKQQCNVCFLCLILTGCVYL